jgi:hypothetical protein
MCLHNKYTRDTLTLGGACTPGVHSLPLSGYAVKVWRVALADAGITKNLSGEINQELYEYGKNGSGKASFSLHFYDCPCFSFRFLSND